MFQEVTGLREISPYDIIKKQSKRYLVSNIILPSQHQSYSICTEFARDWFLEKFKKNFFNNIYVSGKYAYDDFRRFSTIDKKLARANPQLSIIPEIVSDHNREWIDSSPEMALAMRRSKIEGSFFNDIEKGIHTQIMFKTILMNFNFRIKLDTRAEQLDMLEFIKINHRAGFTESRFMTLDIHVPRELIGQIAYDTGIEFDEDTLDVKEPIKMLNYLNSHSYIPFVYKMRCSNGHNEFFIKVPNCCAHLKMEMPTKDDGERSGVITTNFFVEFSVEVQMLAPYAYIYYSQIAHNGIIENNRTMEEAIAVMVGKVTEVPKMDEHRWQLYTTTEYLVEKSDLGTEIEIDMEEFLNGCDIKDIIKYTRDSAINPAMFINFKFFQSGFERTYDITWSDMKCKIKGPCDSLTTVIAVYADMKYINETVINLGGLKDGRIN